MRSQKLANKSFIKFKFISNLAKMQCAKFIMDASVKSRRCVNVSALNVFVCACLHNFDGSFLGVRRGLGFLVIFGLFFDQAVHKFASQFGGDASPVVVCVTVRRVWPKSLFVADDLPF